MRPLKLGNVQLQGHLLRRDYAVSKKDFFPVDHIEVETNTQICVDRFK
jgi:hypothetical protein